jgi:thiosulfate/3-mercaptopyruvate sulfurtransferase
LSKDASRIWYILRYFGVRDVRLLNGGWPAWQAAKLPTSAKEPAVTAVPFLVVPEPKRLADQAAVAGILNEKSAQIVDCRSEAEFVGNEKKAKRSGHIPGAVHLEWSDALDKTTQRFKNSEQLKVILKEAGIDVSRPIVTHCQSGGRSSVMAFTLELMGAYRVANYYRGWSEWGNADQAPVETAPKKK